MVAEIDRSSKKCTAAERALKPLVQSLMTSLCDLSIQSLVSFHSTLYTPFRARHKRLIENIKKLWREKSLRRFPPSFRRNQFQLVHNEWRRKERKGVKSMAKSVAITNYFTLSSHCSDTEFSLSLQPLEPDYFLLVSSFLDSAIMLGCGEKLLSVSHQTQLEGLIHFRIHLPTPRTKLNDEDESVNAKEREQKKKNSNKSLNLP